ncbi:hypothetical protein J3R83DRAFT_11555 [Lanmaoa asiatica]|nr:hypothetical protein J3R83DRAFT_11555 [Lanmaoa asiatica]
MTQVLHRLRELPTGTHVNVFKRFSVRRRDARDSERVASAKDSEYDQFFRYTSGRWIYNERERERLFLLQTLLIRKLCGNAYQICVLQRRCPQASCRKSSVQPRKVALKSVIFDLITSSDRFFQQDFLLTFDNGKKLIAKIPCPVVVSRRLCTASEVATMDCARNILSLPVPRILSWSANADASEVGTEYIPRARCGVV